MSDDKIIGPALPPGFLKTEEDLPVVIGPKIPEEISSTSKSDDSPPLIGPIIPSDLIKENKEPVTELYGPVIPPHLLAGSSSSSEPKKAVIGPSLPPNFSLIQSDSPIDQEEEEEEDDEDANVIGPLPTDDQYSEELQYKFALSKALLRDEQEQKNDTKPKREEWMTQLPAIGKSFGLEARTFNKKTVDKEADRSIWTDTPVDKKRKELKKFVDEPVSSTKSLKERLDAKYDDLKMKAVEDYNEKTRGESLMSLHQKKLKRKATEDAEKPKEWRPFDRDEDMKIQKVDGKGRERLMQNANSLESKFSFGQKKFL